MPQKKKQSDKVDKRYRAKVTIPGVEKPVWVSSKTKAALEDEKRRVKEEYVSGPRREDMPFVDLIREWWEVCKSPTVRTAGTRKTWNSILENWVLPAFPPQKLSRSVTRRDLQDCLNRAEGLNANHISHIKAALRGACLYGLSEGILKTDPSILLTPPKARDPKAKRPFTRVEEERILTEAEHAEYTEQSLIYVLYYFGLRIGETLGLRWEDVLWKKELIHVQRDVDHGIGALKTKAANRYVPIPAPMLIWMKKHRGLPDQYVVGGTADYVDISACRAALARVMFRCGFYDWTDRRNPKKSTVDIRTDVQSWFSPHYFRHHFITSCVQADLRAEYIMSIVGHSSYKVTIETYTHIQHQMLEDDYQPTHLSEVLGFETKVAKRLPRDSEKVQLIQ